MSRVTVLVLALVVAFVSPLRQACSTTCVDLAGRAVPAARSTVAPQPSCHETAPPPQPPPDADRCSHDHSGTLRPATSASLQPPPNQPATVSFATVHMLIEAAAVMHAPGGTTRGSPPLLRTLQLRI